MPSRWGVVVPTCRPAEFERFLKAWEPLFAEHEVTVYPVRDEPASWESWPDWVPRRSDMCRSYGFWQAWKNGHEFTLSLDDDVRPIGWRSGKSAIDIFDEYERGFDQTWPCIPYLSVGSLTDSNREMRGFPYEGRGARCMVQYGGWDGVLDYDGKTQLAGVPDSAQFAQAVIPVPRGCAVTTCAMNVAFRTEFTPCMWQLPLLEGRYNRWGDIWSGLIQKRVLDARGEVMLVNGRASVLHERASDPARNAEVEAPGMPLNDHVWKELDRGFTKYRDLALCLGDALSYRDYPKDWFVDCLDQWLALFDQPRFHLDRVLDGDGNEIKVTAA